jgi:hypothetical protein
MLPNSRPVLSGVPVLYVSLDLIFGQAIPLLNLSFELIPAAIDGG